MTRFHLAALLGVVGLIAAAVVGMPRARYAAYDNQGALALRALDKSARAPGFAGGIAPEESRDAFRFPSDDNDLEFGPSQGSSNLSDVTPVASGPNNIQRIQQSATDRYLIKNATVTMEATDPRAAATQLSQWVANAGGYISDLNETVDSLDRRTLSMQVRVPSKDFDRLMGQLGTFGKTLETHITSQDVTEEFVDVQARLKNLKETELRLVSHLQDSRKVEDTLRIESELTRVRGEIERLEGRLRYLAHRVDFSTVALTIRPAAAAEPVVPPESFSTGKEVSAALREVLTFLLAAWATLIWLGIWGIIWIPLALLAWLIVRRLRIRFTPPPSTESAPATPV